MSNPLWTISAIK